MWGAAVTALGTIIVAGIGLFGNRANTKQHNENKSAAGDAFARVEKKVDDLGTKIEHHIEWHLETQSKDHL